MDKKKVVTFRNILLNYEVFLWCVWLSLLSLWELKSTTYLLTINPISNKLKTMEIICVSLMILIWLGHSIIIIILDQHNDSKLRPLKSNQKNNA